MNFKDFILEVPDFPKKGILFRDISPLIQSHLKELIEELAKLIDIKKIDYFAGIESRGFIVASALAAKLSKGVIMIRKKGKLPPPVYSVSYNLEYGSETLEMKQGKGNVIIVDDVLASGGTLNSAIELAGKAGYTINDILVIINLTYLNNFIWNDAKVKSLISY